MLESGTIQASNLWVPYTYVWRFQYYDSKSIHGIISTSEKYRNYTCIGMKVMSGMFEYTKEWFIVMNMSLKKTLSENVDAKS